MGRLRIENAGKSSMRRFLVLSVLAACVVTAANRRAAGRQNYDERLHRTPRQNSVDQAERVRPSSQNPVSVQELIENDRRVRELRKQFPTAQLILASTDDPQTRAFELVDEGREFAGGFVNLGSGRVELREASKRDENDERSSLLGAVVRAMRFPLEGGGLFWFTAAVTALVAFPFSNPLRAQSLDLIAIVILLPLSMVVWEHRFETFVGLFVVTAYLAIRCVRQSIARVEMPASNVSVAVLCGALSTCVGLHVYAVLSRGPDDSGIWSVFGGQHLWRHRRLPYGQIGEGATYGPLLYAIHAPVAAVLPPTAPGDNGDGFRIEVDRHNFERVGYQNCDFLPAKVVMIAFDVLVLTGLVLIGGRRESFRAGLFLSTIVAANGLVIQRDLLFISHVAPTTCVIWAIVLRARPLLSGLMLGGGAAILFWPGFLAPLWLGYFGSRSRSAMFQCGLGIALVACLSLGGIWRFTEPVGSRGPLRVFWDSTWRHQEGTGSYGGSQFGLWGSWSNGRRDRDEQIRFIKLAVRNCYFLICLVPLAFCWARQPVSAATLVSLAAAMALGLQFWKTHAGGLYTGWYLPLVIASLLAPEGTFKSEPQSPSGQNA
jgi:hypothetical protein